MKAVIFVPGTMGSELVGADGKLLWPPEPLETVMGYGRIDQLVADGVTVGGVIRSVACFNIYGSLLDDFQALGYTGSGSAKRLYLFPYDWRMDLQDTAARLAALLATVDAQGATEITIVAHSMGGLVSRLVLESGEFPGSWFNKVRTFIAIATPHQGAPLALARILGLDSDLGISKEGFKTLTNDRRYPSGYQLLPAPNEPCCWDSASLSVAAVDIYDEAVGPQLGLDAQLLARARYVHGHLGKHARPPHVRYFYFAATGHETVTRVNVRLVGDRYLPGTMHLTHSEDAGDGTVPFWSALPTAGQKQVVVNEHSQAFTGMKFRRVFHRLLGGDLGTPLEARDAQAAQALGMDPVRLSMPKPVIPMQRPFELLLVPPLPGDRWQGTFVLSRLAPDGSEASSSDLSRLDYSGPAVTTLRLEMPGIVQPGPYSLRFVGLPRDSLEVRFAVTQVS